MTIKKSKHRLNAVLIAALAFTASASVAATGSAGMTPVAVSSRAPVPAPATAAPLDTPGRTAAASPSVARTGAASAAGAAVVPLNLPAKPTTKKPKQVKPVASSTCPTSGAHVKQNAAQAGKPVVCLTADPIAVSASTQTAAGSVTPKTFVGSNCLNKTGVWEVDRTTACIKSWGLTADIRYPNGPVIGTQHFLVNQDIILNTNGPGITEQDTITRDHGTGEFAADWVIVHFASSCGSKCLTNNPANAISLPNIGSTADFTLSYSDAPALGQKDTFDTFYNLSMDFLDQLVGSDSISWSSPEAIRCDNMLAPRSPGCVFPQQGPTLNLSVSVYGAAAVNVAIGQKYLNQPYGTVAAPLTRGNPSVTDPNRDAICDSSFFPSLILVPNDSCDEYPFASSQQSGAQRGFTGASCLETIALQKSDGSWVIYLLHGNVGAQPCERGHVPNDLNRAVGTAVGTMYTNNRMITGDAYIVEVDN
ncbi:hypothetical protein [Actinacidiphila epipremni]|uniref:Secreted protein n=1 Tax=Actinacidiphila epipremni TaxID=2053013 RepID=A0ABX0ZSA3_9ACTN|nr:hypothetical protein [Actinacidiphila epipremni]NJP46848.1 hypothetical protein [Actinacidiphila epipremni]